MKVLEKQELNNVAGGFFWGLILNIWNPPIQEPRNMTYYGSLGNYTNSNRGSNGSTWG